MTDNVAVIRGGGDLGTGAALRLQRAGWRVLVCELPRPLAIRRAVSLATAMYDGTIDIEGTLGVQIRSIEQAADCWSTGQIPVIADPDWSIAATLLPLAVVDAIMAKRNTGTRLTDAPIVVALGPGFEAGVDCHAVVETHRGHNLGRVYYRGAAEEDTGVPGNVGGEEARRAMWAHGHGEFYPVKVIGDHVRAGSVIAMAGGSPVIAEIDGVVRGLLPGGLMVSPGQKVADIDPRGVVNYCFTVSDRSWAVAGGVLEAVLYLRRKL